MTSKEKNDLDEKTLEEIVVLALSEMNLHSKEVYEYLVSLARNESLEKHQTEGNIIKFAENLLKKLRGDNNHANS